MGLDTVELVLDIEESFSISITNDEAETISTPRDCAHVIAGKIADRGPIALDTILARVIERTSEHSGVPIGEIGPDSRFIEDLGMD